MNTPRKAGILLGLGVLGLASVTPAHAQFVVSYFNFNSLPSTSSAVDVTTISPNIGTGSLSTNFNTSTTGSNFGVTNFGGTTVNREGSDPNGQSLALQGGTGSTLNNNGNYLELRTNTTGFTGITLSFATQRTASGFNSNQLSYSTDGGSNYTTFGTPYNPATAFAAQSFDLSSISALNNQSDVRFRITFSGATTAAGNNRIDNLKVTAATPAPSSVAVMAMGGLTPLVAFARRRRAAK